MKLGGNLGSCGMVEVRIKIKKVVGDVAPT
jgi:hypothetical protein